MPPRALHPSGIFLVDKPAGPTSFAIVADDATEDEARTGHAGTLDPFATGLLLLLSGAVDAAPASIRGALEALRDRDRPLGAHVDRRLRRASGSTSTTHLAADELHAALDGLRGAVDLPIPAVSAVKIDGERAYALHRRGVAVEMPVRTMHVHELALDGYADGIARLDLLVSSGTYIRAIADAARRALRVAAAHGDRPVPRRRGGSERLITPEDALARLA